MPRAAARAIRSSTPGRPHPRTYGSTARVLGTYVRDRGHAVARDRDRQADLRAGRPRWPARPRDRARRIHSPTSWCSIRRPSRTRPPTCSPPATRPASTTSSSTASSPCGTARRRGSGPAGSFDGARDPLHPRRHRAAGDRASRGRARPVHAASLAARPDAAGRHPPGPGRRRDRAGGRSAGMVRPGAPRDHIPRRTGAMAPPASHAARRRPRRAGGPRRTRGRRPDPVSGRPASPSDRARAGGPETLERGTGRRRDRGPAHRPPGACRSPVDRGGARGLVPATGEDRDRAGRRPVRGRVRDQADRCVRCATHARAGGVPHVTGACRSPGGSSSPHQRRSRPW